MAWKVWASNPAYPVGATPAVYAGLWGLAWFSLSALRAHSLFAGAFDLGYFVQALGRLFSRDPTTFTGWGLFDDHFSPLAVILVPLARGSVAPFALLLAQAATAAVSVYLVFHLAMRVTNDRSRSLGLMVAYSAAPPLLYALWFDFHPTLLGLPFLVLLLLGLESGSVWRLAVGAAGLSMAREDMAVLSIVLLALSWRRVDSPNRWVMLIPALILAVGLVVIGDSWFLRQGLATVDAGGGAWEVLKSIAASTWADGLLVLLVGALLTPWLILRLVPTVSLWSAVALVVPLLLLPYTVTKYAGFHYYAAVPALLVKPAAVRSTAVPHWRMRLVAGVAIGAFFGPLGASAFAPGLATLPDVLYEVQQRGPVLAGVRAFDRCLHDVGVSRTVVDQVAAIAPPGSAVAPWPLPFRSYVPIVGAGELVPRDVTPRPDIVIRPGVSWGRDRALVEEATPLEAEGYEHVGRLGAGLLEVWARPEARALVEVCAPSADEQVFAPVHR